MPKRLAGTAALPNYAGMTLREAEIAMAELGVRWQGQGDDHGKLMVTPDWIVTAQDPVPGTEISAYDQVQLTLTKPTETATPTK